MTIRPAMPQSVEPSTSPTPVYDANDLTQGGNKAHILLGDQVYLLRITRAGKLILTK